MIKIRTAAVIGSILVGAMTGISGATVAQAQPTMTSSVQGSVASVSVNSRATSGGQPAPAPATPTAPQSTERGVPIGPVINWIKRNAPSIINSLKSALRNGWSAFVKWWNGLAAWIRAGISAVAQMALQQIFDALWHYFFG